MSKRTIVMLSIFALGMLVLLLACGTSTAVTTVQPGGSGSGLDGQALMQQHCSVCHSVDRITSAHKSASQWKNTVDRMIANGATLTPQEEQTLVTYLAQNYK